jgi:hypothetical protein
MKEPLYRDALRFGWQFAWKNKFLWIYGIFAAMLGQLGMFEILARATGVVAHATTVGVRLYFFRFPARMFSSFFDLAGGSGWAWLVWLFLLGIGILAVVTVLAVASQGALIHAAGRGKHGREVSSDRREWHAGMAHFWRLLFLNAGKKLVIAILAVIVGWAAYAASVSSSVVDFFLFLSLFILAVLVGMTVSFFTLYAACYVVVEERAFTQALAAAWKLLKGHWLVSLEVGILFLLFNIALAITGLLGFFLLMVPAMLLWFLAFFIGNAFLFAAGMVFLVFCFAAFAMFLGAVFTVFSTAAWTHLFLHMHRYGVPSRILEWLNG